MITVTVVRHGESTDNLKACWAGWADAPLSVHGMNQAKALGESFKTTHIDHIFASTLLRALWTAQQIEKGQPDPKPTFTTSPLLREQHFGVAERKPFGEGKGGYVRQPGRGFRFDEGESLEDVRQRANEAIAAFIEPVLRENHGQPATCKHLVVVAHGIFNAEFIGALLARRKDPRTFDWGYRGMTNTGWTRLEVGYASETNATSSSSLQTDPDAPEITSSRPTESPPLVPMDSSLRPLVIRVMCTDVTSHLDGVHRQKGGIGSQGFDEKQKDLRTFFAGGKS